jgi:adenylate kinase family enzyme
MPVVEYYKTNPSDKFVNINGEQTIEEVHGEIISKLI